MKAISTSSSAAATASAIEPELLRLLETLPRSKQIELLDFARFLHEQVRTAHSRPAHAGPRIELRAVSATTLLELTGLVALGGDAVVDSEALYDGDDNGLH